jgi:hypothetical protein
VLSGGEAGVRKCPGLAGGVKRIVRLCGRGKHGPLLAVEFGEISGKRRGCQAGKTAVWKL